MAVGEYGTASHEELAVLNDVAVPSGLLDSEESTQFNTTIPQQQKADEPSDSSMWKWILGILLIAAGI
jgi:hypothetical protein